MRIDTYTSAGAVGAGGIVIVDDSTATLFPMLARYADQIVADHNNAARLAEAERDLARARKALEASRIPHLRLEGDPWFNCDMAKMEDSDNPTEYPDPRCDCGATEHNARIAAALAPAGGGAVAQPHSYSPCCACDGTGRRRGEVCDNCYGTCCSYHYKAVDPSCSSCRIA